MNFLINKKSIILSLSIFFALTSLPLQAKEMTKNMQHLLKLFELNEAGVAYLRHCSNYEETIKANPYYMANAKIIFVTLTGMMVENGPKDATQEMASEHLMELRKPLIIRLDKLYKEKGCNSKQALAAKGYFEEMSKTNPKQTMTSINKMNGKIK